MKRDLTEGIEVVITGSATIRGIAKWLSAFLSKIFLESPLRPLKNFLNGTWLEHPLHPVLTDVPVGAWTIAMVLYIAALAFNVKGLGLATGITLGFGVLAALGAIVTGFMEWMDVDPAELSVGLVHATINIVSTIFFAISFYMLYTGNWELTLANFIPALVGYGLLIAGAYIGGSLVFRMGTMINRNAYRHAPKDFTAVVGFTDLPENEPKRFDVKGEPILLLRRGQRVYAVGAVCSHYGGPLEKGKVEDTQIECPWHYSKFSLEDGSYQRGPTTSPLPVYETDVKDGQVWVKLIQIAPGPH